jgi:hypothetical protein
MADGGVLPVSNRRQGRRSHLAFGGPIKHDPVSGAGLGGRSSLEELPKDKRRRALKRPTQLPTHERGLGT